MNKFLIILFAISLSINCAFSSVPELRDYAPLVIKKGGYFRVLNQRTLNTGLLDEGDTVTFIAPTDVWCAQAKIIPRDSVYYGYVEEVREPVQGTNAALKIRVNKVVTPNGVELPIDAYLSHGGKIEVGGELTAPLEYTKMPHHIRYPNVYKGVLQYVPGNKRFYGHHLVIKPGAELILLLNSDFNAINADF